MLRLILGSKRSAPPARERRHDELAELAQAVQHGDQAALRTFLATIIPHLLRVARRVLGSSHPEIEDVAHEAAYAVVDQLPRFRGEGTVLHFACRIAVLSSMNVRRSESARKRTRAREVFDLDLLRSHDPDPEEQAMSGALAPVVRELLDTLSKPLAEALALHVVLGYTVGEIAEMCGVPDETVRSRLRLAKKDLKARMIGHPLLGDAAEVGR